MKTAVTVINTIQVGMDEYKDFKETKTFNDDATIKDIKRWVQLITKSKRQLNEISINECNLSNVNE